MHLNTPQEVLDKIDSHYLFNKKEIEDIYCSDEYVVQYWIPFEVEDGIRCYERVLKFFDEDRNEERYLCVGYHKPEGLKNKIDYHIFECYQDEEGFFSIGIDAEKYKKFNMRKMQKESKNNMNELKLKMIRNRYVAGTVVELMEMNDPQAPPIGTRGKVIAVDDAGQILVNWDNGSTLSLIPGVDLYKVVSA